MKERIEGGGGGGGQGREKEKNVRVIEPRRDGNGVVDVEDVRCGRVVDNDALAHRSSKLREILRRTMGQRVPNSSQVRARTLT